MVMLNVSNWNLNHYPRIIIINIIQAIHKVAPTKRGGINGCYNVNVYVCLFIYLFIPFRIRNRANKILTAVEKCVIARLPKFEPPKLASIV